jgi:hypothetical protein
MLGHTSAGSIIAAALAGCGSDHAAPASEAARYAVRVAHVDTRFETRDHFIASIEMQLSGEPFAEAMGRDLGGYSRTYTCQSDVCEPDLYVDPLAPASDGGVPRGRPDVAGFSSAIESYEYSKQPMNNAAFESGAGTSLLYGPVLNPGGATGAAALGLARDWVTHLANSSNATTRFIRDGDDSPFGWPGLWLTLQPYSSWDPTIHPTNLVDCSLTSDDNSGAHKAVYTYDYECNYDSLHLANRANQITTAIDPGSSGFLDWKESLWAINYLQSMHDVHEQAVDAVDEEELSNVGMTGNTVGPGLKPGTYLGSSDIEGFQAGNFLQILDNQAAQWLSSLSTTDGKTLDGFGSVADALSYSDDAPLRWFPASIRVTEDADDNGFPRPSSYVIASPDSHLLDLAGLLGAYASVYALTDAANAEIGGSQAARVYFDGDPFPAQNQSPDGERTLHDRALAMMRVLIVNMMRLHFDTKVTRFTDDASVHSSKVQHGDTLSADVAAYALLALRTARRSLHSELSLYGNTKPDTAGIPSPLDAFPLARGNSIGALVDRLIQALAASFYDDLTASDGRAFSGWDLSASRPTDDGAALDAHTAAIRGLLTAYLATGATKFRDRAQRVWVRLDGTFYDPRARMYRPAAGDQSTMVTFTPRRFGLLQAALRDTYELVAALPGHESLRALIEDRVGRLNALVLNGWDDRNGDDRIQWPDECAHLGRGPDGLPLGLGGLQMGERALTGETGPIDATGDAQSPITTDRDHDCVPEISAVGLPAALARSITFELVPLAAAGDAGGAR